MQFFVRKKNKFVLTKGTIEPNLEKSKIIWGIPFFLLDFYSQLSLLFFCKTGKEDVKKRLIFFIRFFIIFDIFIFLLRDFWSVLPGISLWNCFLCIWLWSNRISFNKNIINISSELHSYCITYNFLCGRNQPCKKKIIQEQKRARCFNKLP